MSTSRREFLKAAAIAGAGAAIETIPTLGEVSTAGSGAGQSAESNSTASEVEYTRGIGVYPGVPSQNFNPELVPDTSTYRNLAFLRPAFHSSSYDYNLTAQLVTDGIKDARLPTWVVVSDPLRGPLPKEERENIVNHAPTGGMQLQGPRPFVDIQFGGGQSAPEIDRVDLFVVAPALSSPATLRFAVSVSADGRDWQPGGSTTAPPPASTAGLPPDLIDSGPIYAPSILFNHVSSNRFYRIECQLLPSAKGPRHEYEIGWKLGQVAFYRGNQRLEVGGPYSFTSAWMGAGMGEEWVYVDLGMRCEFDRIALYWIARAAAGAVQISDDAHTWHDLESLDGRTGPLDDFKLSRPAQARYVRVFMTRPASAYGYILSEIEVYGRGGFVARPKPSPAAGAGGGLHLGGGAWRLQRANFITAAGEEVSKPGFQDSDWLVATVPGTTLTSYLNIGAVPDPNFGQNQLHISDSYFYSDFWYRTEFTPAAIAPKKTAWLNFDGINWKAEIYFNGQRLGRIEGGFMRGRFDVTGKLIPGKPNALAVRVEKNATPGSAKQKTFANVGKNGGGLGADNPTYHASIGWDWIPTIRGRNTGIWGDVYLAIAAEVTIEDPLVSTKLPLPDTASADISVQFDLVNHLARPFSGTVRGNLGEIGFERRVALRAKERQKIRFDSTTHPTLSIKNPRLWWPVGYGEPFLYDATLSIESGKRTLDSKSFKAGLRQMTYSEDGGALKIWINGRRLVARGGNWGFGESMLRYRAREYDAAVRYHREMNFTMIRNWVGQIGDEALYDACDRHGVMVWHDFWLANPWDGPEPDDDAMFLANVRDFVLRIRNHASIGLYCGRNEGFPPPPLEAGIRKILGELHADLHYIPSSADNVVSGHGPYQAMPPRFYFQAADFKLHSEIGAPNIPPVESVRMMMPDSALWPQGLDWGMHDFCLNGAQGGSGFRAIIENKYGGANSAEEWIRLAQLVNYDTYRAMFESQSRHRMGVLLWMSHSCWPSLVWQTYDYFFEPTAAYFGCKKGSEPLHIQWNPNDDTIEVVNYSGGNVAGLNAQVEILNMDGSRVIQNSALLDSREDSTTVCIKLQFPAGLSSVHFLRLSLTRGSQTVSSNFYLRSLIEGDFRAIRDLPSAQIRTETSANRQGQVWRLTSRLLNTANWPALMVRLKATGGRSGDRILPAIYSDKLHCTHAG